jgi:hypothetical protein
MKRSCIGPDLIANTTDVIYYDRSTILILLYQVEPALQNINLIIGNANYDVAMFGAWWWWNAGCIGCVCVDPPTNSLAKKEVTSPADGIPREIISI